MNAELVNQRNPRLSCSGRELREMFCVATRWLERNATIINALNVFPVPDGDTGTNMLLTMRSTMAEAARASDTDASEITQAMARGALMGARGNSGVILSQIMKGFARGFADHMSFGPGEMAQALDQASIAAYEGISKPREGTMLTVIKDVASAARSCTVQDGQDLLALMQTVVDEARESVERTPQLLDVLREAGVVDAGGQGIFVILEGILYYLRGEEEKIDVSQTETVFLKKETPTAKQPVFIAARSMPREERAYGFCTEVIIKGSNLNQNQIRRWVESQGESVLVVGDAETVKIHVHTLHPGMIIEFAISLGSVHDPKIQNMDDQHEDFVQMRRTPMPASDISVLAVVAGVGLESVFRSLGTTAVIPGGQTMNPSCADILQAIDSVPSDKVIVLPNNKNVIPAAKQAATVAKKKVKVLPTRSIPQGLSALVGFNCEKELDLNLREMSRAQERVRSVEITNAVRDARMSTLQIKKGDYIGLVDGNIRVASNSLSDAVFSAFKAIDAGNAGIASLFYGDQIDSNEATDLSKALKEQYPGLEVEVIQGGQPHYSYIISVE
jgi:DAK2 domain fusion protein YloV